ncbi:phenylacetate--CoA ligase family protein [Vibrio diabolicus]|uniref:phenylacetate--CoA ligase family protein n=1 Tax=Vibrio diabolicus TaxID=50719 RepID=UPI00062E5AA4|nr:AMP-binding protein [Vibrio diabolicus]KLE26128.1 AMP-dependent synthetase [Vibrio diabolicus]MCS0311938.1 AMP-binding protein [Vibrio diabolicus]MCS0366293.1 AMP-binding protein [Vibrio diabolicus]
MNKLFDAKESLSPQAREESLFQRLPTLIENAKANSEHYAEHFAELEPALANNREALAQFPITRKFNMPSQQQLNPPFGGLNSVAIGQMARVFQSPGPLYEAQTDEMDFWRMGRAFHAAGFCAGDLVHNTLSYHFSPGGFIMDGGARACGCAVFPAGVGNTEAQVEAIKQLQPTGYTGTPSYLLTLLQKYQEKYGESPSFTKALVSGEAVTADMQQMFEVKGITVFQAYASAELGLIAYQVTGEQGLVIAEDIIVEIVDPDGVPVQPGEVGEVVVTSLDEKFPLIRYATGDLSAYLDTGSDSPRTNARIKGWMGRADSAVKVKGLFVYPHQIQEVCRRHDIKGSLKIERDGFNDAITFCCHDVHVSAEDIQATLQSVTKLKGNVQFVPNQAEQPLINDLRS